MTVADRSAVRRKNQLRQSRCCRFRVWSRTRKENRKRSLVSGGVCYRCCAACARRWRQSRTENRRSRARAGANPGHYRPYFCSRRLQSCPHRSRRDGRIQKVRRRGLSAENCRQRILRFRLCRNSALHRGVGDNIRRNIRRNIRNNIRNDIRNDVIPRICLADICRPGKSRLDCRLRSGSRVCLCHQNWSGES